MIERTFVAIKPDGVQRGLVGEIIKRFEQRGLKIVAMKMVWADQSLAEKHYEAHKGKAFFDPLVKFLKEGPIIGMVLEGVDVIANVRKLVGDTEPAKALPGTIRGDFCHVSYSYADSKKMVVKNIIHASGNKEDAEKEIKLWFKPEEIHSYKRTDDVHIF